MDLVPNIKEVCPSGLFSSGKAARNVYYAGSDTTWWLGALTTEEQRQADIEVMGENLARVLAAVK